MPCIQAFQKASLSCVEIGFNPTLSWLLRLSLTYHLFRMCFYLVTKYVWSPFPEPTCALEDSPGKLYEMRVNGKESGFYLP